MLKILVTGAGALLGQGIIRALRIGQLPVRIVAVDPSPLAAGLYWADTAHLVPMAKEARYEDAIRQLLAAERPDAVLVGTDVELAFFAERRAALEAAYNTHVIVSSPRVVEIADDKWQTYLFLREHGFGCPDSALHENVSALVARVGFPLVVKPRRGARSVGVSVVHSETDLARALEEGTDLVVQELVGDRSTEYTSGLLTFDRRCAASITMRRDLRDGNTYRAFPIPDFPYDRELRRIAEALDPYGPVNLQFRLTGTGVKVFEINSRFSGTTPLRGLVGFPEVEMVLRRVLRSEAISQPIVLNHAILRHWSETVVRSQDLLS